MSLISDHEGPVRVYPTDDDGNHPARRKTDQAEAEVLQKAQAINDDQAQDRFAEWLFTVVAVGGLLILLSFLWWASKGGRWVVPW